MHDSKEQYDDDQIHSLEYTLPWLLVNLALPRGRSPKLGIVKEDEVVVGGHVDICL